MAIFMLSDHEPDISVLQYLGSGACRKISSTREQNELCAARKFFSVLGLARKDLGLGVLGLGVLGLGVQGLKLHVLELKMVFSDLSNCS